MPHVQSPNLPEPSEMQADLWRYLNFDQLLWLLQNNSLYFSRVDKFDDDFEGRLPENSIEELKEIYTANGNFQKEHFREHLRFQERVRKNTFANCWHKNDVESMAMWQQYSDSAVAIRSTVFRLSDSLGGIETDRLKTDRIDEELARKAHISITPIQYENFTEYKLWRPNETTLPFRFKQNWYEYEQEIRAIITMSVDSEKEGDEGRLEDGVYITVDIPKLIDKIVLSPKSREWQYEAVQQLAESNGLSKEKIEYSAVDSNPVHKTELLDEGRS